MPFPSVLPCAVSVPANELSWPEFKITVNVLVDEPDAEEIP